jgi:hypothetical protein
MNSPLLADMPEFVALFARRGLIKFPPRKTTEQALAEERQRQREYEKSRKRILRAKLRKEL